MSALAHSDLFWVALIFGLLGLYILPTVIAVVRGVEGLGWIIVINLLPTGIGWLAALIGALMLPRREPPSAPSLSQHGVRIYPHPAYSQQDHARSNSWHYNS